MILDENMVVARVERLTLHDLRQWVGEGWVRPALSEHGPVFDELDVARIRLLCDLTQDMSLPIDTLPVVLTLIDRLNEVRREARCLSDALESQPEDIRGAVVRSYLAMREEEGAGRKEA